MLAAGSVGFLIAFPAGLVTSLSPCVLPMLPVVAGSAQQRGKFGPVALVLGLITSFTLLGLSFGFLAQTFALSNQSLRVFAAALLILAGLFLAIPKLQDLSAKLLGPLAQCADRFSTRHSGEGYLGQFFVGALLGAIWSPCTGPTLGAAFGFAAAGQNLVSAGLVFFVFAVGASVPLLAFAYGSRALMSRRGALLDFGAKGKVILGAMLIATGLLVLSGFDKSIEIWILNAMPDSFVDFLTLY